jgi:hypothetical protein
MQRPAALPHARLASNSNQRHRSIIARAFLTAGRLLTSIPLVMRRFWANASPDFDAL